MPDNLSPEDRRRTMQSVKSKRTRPERRIRGMLAGKGLLGWSINSSDVIGNPDFVFPNEKVAIFIDGCFWHGCPICNRPLPKSNIEYWTKKITRNAERDNKNNALLEENGWRVVRVWEHDVDTRDGLQSISKRILAALQLNKDIRG